MSRAADSIRTGLKQALRYAQDRAPNNTYRVHVPERIDVKAIRTKLQMTQQTFAARFGFSINALRHWEQGKRQPEGPTRACLLVIDRAPETVQKAPGRISLPPTPDCAQGTEKKGSEGKGSGELRPFSPRLAVTAF